MKHKQKKSKSAKPISKWSEYLFDKRHASEDPYWHFKEDIAYDIEIMISNLMHKLKVNQDCTPEEAKAMAINLIMEQLLPMQRKEASSMQRAMIFSIFFDSPDLEDIRNKYFGKIESVENNQRLLRGESVRKGSSIFSIFRFKKKTKKSINHHENESKQTYVSPPAPSHHNHMQGDNTALNDFIAPVKQPTNNYNPNSNQQQAFSNRTESPVISASRSRPYNYDGRQKKKSLFSFFKGKKSSKGDYESIKNRARH